MGASVRWDGLDELRAALRSLPADLAAEASGIVTGAAEGAKSEIVSAYQARRRTGNLAKGVKIIRGATNIVSSRFGVGLMVTSTAEHAWLFENGSQARHYVTVAGKKHLTGSMPPARIFVPIAIRRRRLMHDQLKAMLVRHGLSVSGEP